MNGLCLVTGFVLEQPMFSLQMYPPNMEKPHLGHSDFPLLSQSLKAEYRLWILESRNVFKGFSWLQEVLKVHGRRRLAGRVRVQPQSLYFP